MGPSLNSKQEVLSFIAQNPELERLIEEVKLRIDDDPGHDMAHFTRVAIWTMRIGDGQLNPRHVIAAAFLHDIVNIPKNSPDRSKASEFCAQVAKELLPQHGFSSDEVTHIADAIRDHSFSRGAKPQTLLGKALQDADRLESLGALGIMRTFSTGVLMKTRYFHSDDPWAVQRQLDDSKFSVDHFYKKIFKLPALMNTSAGRVEAEKRAKTIQSFLISLGEELGIPAPEKERHS